MDIHFIDGIKQYGLIKPLVVNSSNWQISDTIYPYVPLSSLPTPYNQLKTLLPFNPHGWYSKENAATIKMLLNRAHPTTVVELGSWLGKSTVHIAQNLPEGAKVYAVDHWLGSTEHHSPNRKDVQKFLPSLYEQFLSNVIHFNLTKKIIPSRMTTNEAAVKMRENAIVADMVYVDASHDEASVYQDLVNWFPLIKSGGILCGDDWNWGEGFPVRKAVIRYAKEQKLPYHIAGNVWVIIKRHRSAAQ